MRPSIFTDKPVDPKDVRTAIEIANLAPSAQQSALKWWYVEKNAELAKWHTVQTLNRYHQHL